MTSGWGVDPTLDPITKIPTSGTMASDVRKVWSRLYNPGIVSGCIVTTSSTGLFYNITSGVVAVPVTSTETIMVPVPAGTVSTTSGPATGTPRREHVIVRQNSPENGDANSNVVFEVTTTPPAFYAKTLQSYDVKAGTNTTAISTAVGGIDFSIPYGTGGQVLHQWRDTSNAALTVAPIIGGRGSFTLPVDMKIQFTVQPTIGASAGNAYTEARYEVWIDNTKLRSFYTPGLQQAWATFHFEDMWDVTRGTHTVHLVSAKQVGPGTPLRHYGGTNLHAGTLFMVRTVGVID